MKLTQYVGEGRVDESFRFVDKKMDEMAEHLAMNERFQHWSSGGAAGINAATDVGLTPWVGPIKARREILSRGHYLKNIKGYIQN